MDANWSDDIEKVLVAIHISCTLYAEHHKKRYFYLKGYLKYFRIPTIIISGISSVGSVGLQPYMAQIHISMLTCVLALICGIITSIELYLQIQASMENELVASKDFYLLAADIYKILTLSRANRGIGGISYLDEKFGIFCKYIESSHLINHRIRDTLRFADAAIRTPPTGAESTANSVFKARSSAPSQISRISRNRYTKANVSTNRTPDDSDSVSSSVTTDALPPPIFSMFQGLCGSNEQSNKTPAGTNKSPSKYASTKNASTHRAFSTESLSSKSTRMRTALKPTDTQVGTDGVVKMPDFPGSSRIYIPPISDDTTWGLQPPNEQLAHGLLEMVTRTHLSETIVPEITIGIQPDFEFEEHEDSKLCDDVLSNMEMQATTNKNSN